MDHRFLSPGILRFPTVGAVTGQSHSAIYAAIADGLWPKPVPLGARAVGWPAAEVAVMNAARIAGLCDDEIRALVKRLMAARATALSSALAAAGLCEPGAPEAPTTWAPPGGSKVMAIEAAANGTRHGDE